jgi:K+-sensing histidine kinase KdpD
VVIGAHVAENAGRYASSRMGLRPRVEANSAIMEIADAGPGVL